MLSPLALAAYKNAMAQREANETKVSHAMTQPEAPAEGFGEMLTNSLKKVNDMQNSKNDMVQAFAAGKTENVHELMINLQKASMAMQMTTAVRGKLLEAYKELVKMQF